MKLHGRTLFLRLGAVLGVAPMLLLGYAIAVDGDKVWLVVPILVLAVIGFALWRRTAAAAGTASFVMCLAAIALALAGGLVLLPSILLFLAAAVTSPETRWSARRVALAATAVVACCGAFVGGALLLEKWRAPDQLLVRPRLTADRQALRERLMADERIRSIAWSNDPYEPYRVELEEHVDELERGALRRELLSDPDVAAAYSED